MSTGEGTAGRAAPNLKEEALDIRQLFITLSTLILAGNATAEDILDIHRQAISTLERGAIEAYLETLPRDEALYVVEGDLLMTEQEVVEYLENEHREWDVARQDPEERAEAAAADTFQTELIVNRWKGEPDYWKPGDRHLTYAIDVDSFPAATRVEQVATVRERMRHAGTGWSELCSDCGVEFAHLPEHDASPSHDAVRFIVRYHDSGGQYIAAAFFPHDTKSRRYLNIDPSYFSASFDKTGVLRHELGHVLGYRHEHIRDPKGYVKGCEPKGPPENKEWIPITDYDKGSAMHYLCGGGGSWSLELTDKDKLGHRKQYGPKEK